jgi:hypothetical protein
MADLQCLPYESKEELYFSWYLNELKAAEMIQYWQYHPKPFFLSEQVSGKFYKFNKRGRRDIPYTLLQPHEYQADFKIVWDLKARYLFFDLIESPNDPRKSAFISNSNNFTYFSVVDVKGNYNTNDAWRRFSIEQKWVYERYKIYVQKVIVVPTSKGKPKNAIFPSTFTPVKYLSTEKKKDPRKLSYSPLTLNQYLTKKLYHS